MKSNVSLFFKIALVAVIALLMLVPLTMVKSLVRESQNYADGCRAEVSQSWGNARPSPARPSNSHTTGKRRTPMARKSSVT